jgi:hypothetical protein
MLPLGQFATFPTKKLTRGKRLTIRYQEKESLLYKPVILPMFHKKGCFLPLRFVIIIVSLAVFEQLCLEVSA